MAARRRLEPLEEVHLVRWIRRPEQRDDGDEQHEADEDRAGERKPVAGDGADADGAEAPAGKGGGDGAHRRILGSSHACRSSAKRFRTAIRAARTRTTACTM